MRSADICVAGDTSFSADVHCARFNSTGSLKAQREVWVQDLLRCEGMAEFEGRLNCRRLSASGKLLLRQGVSCNHGAFEINGSCISMAKIDEVLSASINGQITATDIGALLNWTKAVDITMRGGDSSVQTITAVTTRVDALDSSRLKAGSISGYSIDIKNTDADNIRANYVAVGKGCHIKLLQYVNAVQVHPEAIVERTEKISPN